MAKRPASEAFHVDKELRKKEGKKHSLDSDEEDSGAEEEKTNVLHADDIEGEEDGVAGMEGEITITPFNMKEELEEGHFDNQGHYHWKKEKEIRDGWLDNIDWVKVKGRPEDKYKIHKDDENKGLGDESSSEDEQPEEKFVLVDNYKEIIQHMKPKETIAKTIQRLGTSTSRPSYNQLEMLVEFLEKNPGIAKGLLRTHQAKLETKRKWANLATSLNALGGASKNGQGWAKYWTEKKFALKKHCAHLSTSIRSTGGGTPINLPTLSTLDNRLLAILGGQDVAICDTRLNVNPLPKPTGPITVKIEAVNPVLEDALIQSTDVSPTPGTSRDDAESIPQATPLSPIRRKRLRRSSIQKPVDTQMERFARIEERRVEAEVITAQALNRLSESFQHMTNSLGTIAEAIKEMARKMP